MSTPEGPVSKTEAVTPSVRPLTVLHVCTACRAPGTPREPYENRAGYQLYRALRAEVADGPLAQHLEVRSAECLSVCPRPCGIALSSPGKWSYLFGDQQVGESVDAIIECALRYIKTPDGFLPRQQRPKSLQASILGRVPR